MNNSSNKDHGEVTVAGFEVPKSPDSSYNNVYPGNDDETRDPPMSLPICSTLYSAILPVDTLREHCHCRRM